MKKKYFLISHNEFAHGLKKALEMIIGVQENVFSFGLMPGNHPDDIAKEIELMITDDTQAVILGDIAGGSVCNSALPLTENPNVALITGVNLPLALEIIISQTTSYKNIETIIKEVRDGIKLLELPLTNSGTEEDFFK